MPRQTPLPMQGTEADQREVLQRPERAVAGRKHLGLPEAAPLFWPSQSRVGGVQARKDGDWQGQRGSWVRHCDQTRGHSPSPGSWQAVPGVQG